MKTVNGKYGRLMHQLSNHPPLFSKLLVTCSRNSRKYLTLDVGAEALVYRRFRFGKLVTVPLTRRGETSDLLRRQCEQDGGREGEVEGGGQGREQNHLTALGLSEAEPQCAMSAGDMWLTTWPCCLSRWSEREKRRRACGQPVQPFAHQWRASPPLNTAY